MREFWTHTDTEVLGFRGEYEFLSNMATCDILWMNMKFNSVEAAYQASKCRSMQDAIEFQTLTGKEAKNQVKFVRPRDNWAQIKTGIMSQLIHQKFLNNKKYRDGLVETYPKYLEETNVWNDTFWGVCDGKGKNVMGKLLMATREYFRYLENDDNG